MLNDPALAGVYTDFQGLTRLKAEARRESPETLREVAGQFEALFTQMMLKSMREASLGEGLLDGGQVGFYRDMYDRQLALRLSEGGSLGLAEILVRQLGGAQGGKVQPAQTAPGEGAPMPARQTTAPPAPSAPAVSSPAPQSSDDPAPASFESPQAFVTALWPHAQRAAERLGVDPEVLLAQAALETGWGRAILTRPDGQATHNLFNIKADRRWQGERVTVPTLEYEGGVAVRQSASFRAYPSYAASFEDYVQFLQDNPRYREALTRAADPKAYTEALQEAGYATDPDYARKIQRILDGATLGGALAGLKGAAERPLS